MPSSPEQAREVRQSLRDTLAAQPLSHWTALLDGVDCCVTPVLRLEESRQLAHFTERGMWVDVDTHGGTRVTQLASPIRMSEFEFEVRCPAPRAGQHTREILSQAGWQTAEIDALMARNIVR